MAWNVPGNDKQDAAHAQVGQEDVDPDVGSHGIEEGEEAVLGGVGFAVQDADAHAHERLGEVDHLLAHVGDGEGSHSHVCFLQWGEKIKIIKKTWLGFFFVLFCTAVLLPTKNWIFSKWFALVFRVILTVQSFSEVKGLTFCYLNDKE